MAECTQAVSTMIGGVDGAEELLYDEVCSDIKDMLALASLLARGDDNDTNDFVMTSRDSSSMTTLCLRS